MAGDVVFSLHEKELTIQQSSKRAIVEWDSFSIEKGEITQFVLPSSSSATLNRVRGDYLSEIYGSLKSNGELILINPNGVLIGPGGLVDVAGFIVSTYDLKNEEFLNGSSLQFNDLANSSASIINQGQIITQTGDVTFIAKNIDNQGQLETKNGNTYLKGGCEVVLIPDDENKIKVRLKKTGSVKNSGTIRAIKAEIEACGNSVESLAVSNTGLIEATGVGEKEGKLVLLSDGKISIEGKLVARNALNQELKTTSGGKIHLLGDEVLLKQGSFIDVSGTDDGGEVLIGGDYHGDNPAIKNASYVFMDAGSTVNADSLINGHGGKVIFWANQGLDMRGRATACGGELGGDGGFIEVSSPKAWSFTGDTSTEAPQGLTGNLLLDPYNLTINSAGPDTNVYTTNTPYYPTDTGAILTTTTIINKLNTSNVEINTGADGAEDGDITIDSEIKTEGSLFSTTRTLTIKAARNINVNADIVLKKKNIAFYINQAGNGGSLIFADGAAIERTYAIETAKVYGNGSSGNSLVLGFAQNVYMTALDTGYTRDLFLLHQLNEFSNIQSITGNSYFGVETTLFSSIKVPAIDNVINITGHNEGNIEGVLSSFKNFQNVSGNTGEDTFKITEDGLLDGILAGGDNSVNTLDLSAKNVENLFFIIYPTDVGIDVSHQCSKLGWIQIANIIGGTVGYSYLYIHEGASLTGTVTFQGPGNWIESGWETPITVDMTNNSISCIYGGAAGGFQNAQNFVATSNANNLVYGPNDGATVTLKGNDVFEIKSPSVDSTFYHFPNLIAGSGDDTFKTQYALSSGKYFINSINGGAGYNVLDMSDWPEDATGTFYATGEGFIPGVINYFSQIQQVILPNDNYLFAEILTRMSIITMVDPDYANKTEKTGAFWEMGVSPQSGGKINFIVNDSLGVEEIHPGD
ncbi:MAG: filamentous hemagglutinin N-terminal domain-containing protein [Parachlamydiales bacterium]